MQNLMDDSGTADVIAIQEPWIGNVSRKKKVNGAINVGNNQITVGHSGYDIVYKQGKGEESGRVMWMVRKDSGLKYTIRDDIWDHWDASIMDVQMEEGRILRICNIYNQDHKKRKGWCMDEWKMGMGQGVDLMMLGDFNARGAAWDTKRESIREDMVMRVVEAEELTLLNEIDRVTRRRGQEESVLDLTWVLENMERKCNWRIVEEVDTGSDHATIEIVYAFAADRVSNPLSKRWNTKKADWEAVQKRADTMWAEKELAWQEAIEGKKIEDIARILEEVAMEAMKEGIPEARMTWRSKKWFDKEVREKRKKVSKHRRWARKGRKEWREEDEKEWKRERNELFRLIREKKKTMWDSFIGEAKSQKEMWTVWRSLNQRIYTKMPTLKDPNDGKRADSFQEKEKLLRRQLFPKAPDRDQERNPATVPIGQLEKVTEKEVEDAINSQGNQKAPGPDGILPEVLKKLGSIYRARLVEGLNTILQEGQHPRRWKTAIGAIIPKPGKGDYTTPRSYRPISLLNTLAKVLEKIVEGRITKKMEEGKKMHKWQWGGRKGRGAEECVEWTLDWAREKQGEGKVVMVVAADIDQAFPNVARKRLGNRLRSMNIEEELVMWTESFMKDRRVKLRFDGREAEWKEVDTGIPQGSPISPMLFNTYIAPLLARMEEYCEEQMPDDAIIPTFIDDVTMVIAGDSWEEVIERGEKAMEEAYKWADENDVRFAEDKLEWIRLGKEKGMDEEEEFVTPKGVAKKESKVMRWLGIWLDRELNFKSHVNIKVKKGENVIARIGRLAKGEEGCGVGNLRKMYIACARSVMDYGSRVWWAGQKGMAEKMDRVDEKAMRRLGGYLRTTPGGAIRVENDLVPTALRLNERQKRVAIRAMNKERSHPMRELAENEIREQERKRKRREEESEWGKKGIRKAEKKGGVRCGLARIGEEVKGGWKKVEKCQEVERREKKWEKKVREELVITIGKGDKEDMEKQKKRREENDEVVMYTDGSKKEGRVGVGVCRIDKWGGTIWEGSYGMGDKMEIMDAEMVGIKKAVEQGMRECEKKKVKILVIRTDSQEAMMRVKKREVGAGEMMARKIRWRIDEGKEMGITTRLEWVKAHANTIGNEKADLLAKAGCKKAKDKDWFISLSYLAANARRETNEEWQKQWSTDPRKGKNYEGAPKTRKETKFPDSERSQKVIIGKLRTGHIWIKSYQAKIKQIDDDQCECGKGRQNVQHILEECGFTIDSRYEAEEKMEKTVGVKELLYSQDGMEYGVKIWKEFKENRRCEREERKEEARELEWGYGDLEK